MLNDGGQRKFTEVAKRSKNGITGGYTYNPSESFLIEEKILENESSGWNEMIVPK